jgi:lysophospholipase L1-like esterase
MRHLVLIVLALLAAPALGAQGAPVYQSAAPHPAAGGTCTGGRVQIHPETGAQWCCVSGKWGACGSDATLRESTLQVVSGVSFAARFDSGVNGCLGVVSGTSGEALAVARTGSNGTVKVGGVEQTCPSSWARVTDSPLGLVVEASRQNYVTSPDAPASQTGTALGVASWRLWIEGSGSISISLASGAATGLPCTATAANACVFDVTSSATVNTTVSGTVTFAQIEAGKAPTSKIHASGTARGADNIYTASLPTYLGGANSWCAWLTAEPSGGLPWGGYDYRGLFTFGDNTAAANSAHAYYNPGTTGNLTFVVMDSAAAAKTLACGNITSWLGSGPHGFAFCSESGVLRMFVDGSEIQGCTTSGAGTGMITTWPANYRIGMVNTWATLNGVVKYAGLSRIGDGSKIRWPEGWPEFALKSNAIDCIGDSITAGSSGGVATPYPTTLGTLLGSPWATYNFGTGGDTTGMMLKRYGAGPRRFGHSTVVVLGGVNDIFQNVPREVIWSNLRGQYDSLRAEGRRVIPVTILPASRTGTQESARLWINTQILGYCTSKGIACVDAAPDFDQGGGVMKAAYNSGDNTHPNQAGADRLAALVRAAFP